MSHQRTKALVLRRTDFSETSLVLALLTEDRGRCPVLVKGAKRAKSRFFGALDLYSLNEVVILDRRSSELGLVTEASPIEVYEGLRRELKRAYAAHAVGELLLGVLHDNEPMTEVFDLTCRTFERMASADGEEVEVHLAVFEVQLLRDLGTELVLERCALCEKAMGGGSERTGLSVTAGGVVCRECAGRVSELIEVSAGTIKVLRALGSGSANMVARMRLSGRIQIELRETLERAYTHLLGRIPRMARLLHGV